MALSNKTHELAEEAMNVTNLHEALQQRTVRYETSVYRKGIIVCYNNSMWIIQSYVALCCLPVSNYNTVLILIIGQHWRPSEQVT